jgi:Flp pilus assembly protein CpaB
VENITSSKLFTTRQGTILLGVIAAVIAAIALLVYLNNYRNSVTQPAVNVLVAQKLIQKGTTGNVIRTTPGYYKLTPYAHNQVENGAITNPATLADQVATTDISPGQQLTASDFAAGSTTVASQLNKNQRAVVISLGSPQAVGGQIAAGSLVDVWVTSTAQNTSGVTRPLAKLLFQNMYVLGVNGSNVTLRTTTLQSGQLIYATGNDGIYLTLRPTIGTVTTKPPVVSAAQVTGR